MPSEFTHRDLKHQHRPDQPTQMGDDARGTKPSSVAVIRLRWGVRIPRIMVAFIPVIVLGLTILGGLQNTSGLGPEVRVDSWETFSGELQRDLEDSIDVAFEPIYATIRTWQTPGSPRDNEGAVPQLRAFRDLMDTLDATRDSVSSRITSQAMSRIRNWISGEGDWIPQGFRTRYEAEFARLNTDTGRSHVVDVAAAQLDAIIEVAVNELEFPPLVTLALNLSAFFDSIRERLGLPNRGDNEFGRMDEFRQEMMSLVDAERQQLKTAMGKAIDDMSLVALGPFLPADLNRDHRQSEAVPVDP